MPAHNLTCAAPAAATRFTDAARVDVQLLGVARSPWMLRVGRTSMIVRPSTVRDLAGVARLHSRCSARSLLDRYRCGGSPPAVSALDAALRARDSFVVATSDATIVATAQLARDPRHGHRCVEVGLLVEDAWQRMGIGRELMTHLAGVAQVAGYDELIAYPATAVSAARRLMIDVGRTRMVPGADLHLHTSLPESATLGLGSVRQRLAG